MEGFCSAGPWPPFNTVVFIYEKPRENNRSPLRMGAETPGGAHGLAGGWRLQPSSDLTAVHAFALTRDV